MSINCPACGHTNRDTATFCARCGQRLSPTVPGPSLPSSVELKQYAHQLWLALGKTWERAVQEARGWYHDFVTQQPEVEGEIITAPIEIQVTETHQFYALVLPVSSHSTRLPALSFQVRDPGSLQTHSVLVVGPRQGGLLYQGDKVRAWGFWNRDTRSLRAWKVEVLERGGQPAHLLVTTGRPFPLAVIATALLGLLLLSCLCSLLGR
jgi:hypothetical protein